MADSVERFKRQVVPTDQDRLAAKLIISDNLSIKEALIQSGFSPHRANRGIAGLTRGIRTAMLELKANTFRAEGDELLANPKVIESTVTGWLHDSMLRGNSRGVNAAKLLGMHRQVDMFKSDNQQNVLVIQAPADWKPDTPRPGKANENKQLPPSEAEFPDYE